MEAQNRLLEKQRAEIEKALADEKRGKRRTTLCADSFVFKLIDTLPGLEKEVRTLKRDLAAYEKANTDLLKAREAVEAREDATERNLPGAPGARRYDSGTTLFPFESDSRGVKIKPC